MTLALSARNKLAASTARRNDIDLAATPGKILLYPEPRPATGAAASGALAVLILSDPCGTVDELGLHLTAPLPAQATEAGLIRWARIVDGDDNFVLDGDVRLPSDADVGIADFIIDVAQVYPGSFINLMAATLAEGG